MIIRIFMIAAILATAAKASATSFLFDDRGVWLRYDGATALVLAECGEPDAELAVRCSIVQVFKGELGPEIRLQWHSTVRESGLKAASPLRLIRFGRLDVPPNLLIGQPSDCLAIPPELKDTVIRYVRDYQRLSSIADPAARNVEYWKALDGWVRQTDPFMQSLVLRDLTGFLSPWHGHVPDVAMAADMGVAASLPAVRSRCFGVVIDETRDNPNGHNQQQVARLLREDACFASSFLSWYSKRPFTRDSIVISAIHDIVQGGGLTGKDPLVRAEAGRVLDDLGY